MTIERINGRFAPGNCGGPGRKKQDNPIVDLCRTHSEEAVLVLVEIMRDAKAATKDRITASKAITDRAYGRPATAVVESDNDIVLPQVVVNVTKEEYTEMQQNALQPDDDEDE